MGVASKIGMALAGALGGLVAGGAIGLGAGLAFVTVAETSGFEGYAGYVAVLWALGGAFLGIFAGAWLALRRQARRQADRH
jgi:hypothetical protein